MKQFILIIIILFIFSCTQASKNKPSSEWINLFDGTSLEDGGLTMEIRCLQAGK